MTEKTETKTVKPKKVLDIDENLFMFFDTETTGLPEKKNYGEFYKYTNTKKYET